MCLRAFPSRHLADRSHEFSIDRSHVALVDVVEVESFRVPVDIVSIITERHVCQAPTS
jgi:hypothetical protein